MSLAAALGEASPPSSGRSSPVPRATRRAVEDGLYKADKSLKRYATAIDRALSTWEIAPEEWADYIAFLGRLLKAVQTHPKDAPILPQSNAIATRLAQCLNPALPSGVHHKALEVYSYIFSTFGHGYISAHLPEFLPGLSAVSAFASLSVRPGLYSLFEDHIVALSTVELRPALKSLILGLLPALEEENSDDFERAFNILHSFEQSFTSRTESDDLTKDEDGYFWQCLFLAVITSPTRRQGALNYLSRRLPTLTPNPDGSTKNANQKLSRDAQCIVSPEPGLLIRCFVCGLSDNQVLIQRGFLDLLVTHLPLSSVVLQEKVGSDDLDRVVSAATQVLMRRDMSLNRRLWSWFLGPEPKESTNGSQPSSPDQQRKPFLDSGPNAQLRYFSDFGRSSLQRCILKMLQNPAPEPSVKARPFRICLSLMDRWEIGGLLISEVFFPAMRALFEYSLNAPPRDVAEVVRSASLFFDGVEASLIWECLISILHDILDREQSPEHALKLFKWIIQTFNVKDEEMLTTHIPHVILYLLSSLDSMQLMTFVQGEILTSTTLLLELLSPRLFADSKTRGPVNQTADEDQDWTAVRKTILDFYRSDARGATAPFENSKLLDLAIQASVSVFSSCLVAQNIETFPKATTLLLALTAKAESRVGTSSQRLRTSLLDIFGSGQLHQEFIPFQIVQAVISLLSSLVGRNSTYFSSEDILQLEPALVSLLWKHLSPERPKYHVEVVKAFWQLEQITSPNDALVAILTELVMGPENPSIHSTENKTEMYRRFMILWGHSIPAGNARIGTGRRSSGTSAMTDAKRIRRALEVLEQPLLLVLEMLSNPDSAPFDMLKAWTQSVGALESILSILFQRTFELVGDEPSRLDATAHQRTRRKQDELMDIDYYLGHFQLLLQHGSSWSWRCLSRMLVHDMNGQEKEGTALLAEVCMKMLFTSFGSTISLNRRIIALLDLLLTGPVAIELKSLDLDIGLLDRLMICVGSDQQALQGALLRLTQLALKLRFSNMSVEVSDEARSRSSIASKRPSIAPNSRPTTSSSSVAPSSIPPPQLFKCLVMGFSSSHTRFHLEQWLHFLAEVLPIFADAIFTNLLPLVECFSRELSQVHEEMVMLSQKEGAQTATIPESVAMGLLDGLEMVLDRAYECLVNETTNEPAPKESESKTSFLSNVTSGVFKAEGPPSRTSKSNNRLTVTLALQDAIRIGMKMWLWASSSTETSDFDSRSSATSAYHALKVRNKSRHLLEQIFSVEPLESLEVIIGHWCNASDNSEAAAALSLIHVMQATRPKNVVPVVLDALCSRTNPVATPAARHSSLTLDLKPSQVATFLSAYLDSTEDDAMDELWPDCIVFLRDVLANPLPYRQVLPHLLSIMLLLSEKLSNTNFGEQRKMRRDLGDIFQRLLTATFTTLPSGHTTEAASEDQPTNGSEPVTRSARVEHAMTLVPVLNRITAKLELLLESSERVTAAINNVTASLLSPTFRARSFPQNINEEFLSLVLQMARKAPTSRQWKKEVSDAFHDPKLIATHPDLMATAWFPILHQWSLHDRERMPELLARLTPPSSAGIMFGVGASAARLEADRRTQFTVRRICLLLLASPEDTYVAHLRPMEEKLAELFEASPSSSPSSAIKAELFMLIRTLAVSVSPLHLAPLWPIINDNLQSALTSLLPNSENTSNFNNISLLQACKLLDMLIALSPDDFQLHEWLYITDTIDAVYQPSDWGPAALSDQIAEALGSDGSPDIVDGGIVSTAAPSSAIPSKKGLLLSDERLGIDKDDIKALPKDEFVRNVVKPFLSQLSIHAYEGVYSLEGVDLEGLRRSVLGDVLDARSIVE